MPSVAIRNLDPEVKQGLRMRAARNGRSMKQEVRVILGEAVRALPRGELSGEELERKVQAILALGRKPDVPFDHKKINDELWDFIDGSRWIRPQSSRSSMASPTPIGSPEG